jgi:hypothetical protein
LSIYTLPIQFNNALMGTHGGDAAPQVDFRG